MASTVVLIEIGTGVEAMPCSVHPDPLGGEKEGSMHVIIDGYGGDPDQLSDENAVRVVLDEYPNMMGMTKITQPTVLQYKGTKPEDWGVSGYVMIAESHIAVHTFPERRLIWADIFSCKDFEPEAVLEDLKQRFGLREMDVTRLERNLEPVPATAAASAGR